jgi:peptide/nickel transport system ATP-binding protein
VPRTVLEARNLRKTYSLGSFFRRIRVHALDDVNFQVRSDGPVVISLIGESGSGKTTLAKALLRLIDLSAGSIVVEERPVVAPRRAAVTVDELRHLVQPIFQNPFEAFNAYRKVDDYLRDTARRLTGASRDGAEQAVADALQSVGLRAGDVVGKYPNQFSGGELQRVSVARALIPRPKLIVADEPVSMIDASLRMNIVNLFRAIKRDYGTSFLYITHDLATAYYISDWIVILYRGCVVEFGRATDVLTRPMHPYTQLLIASVPHVGVKWTKREKMSDLETREYGFAGCKFANRCPHAMDRCTQARPRPVRLDDGRDVYCTLYD